MAKKDQKKDDQPVMPLEELARRMLAMDPKERSEFVKKKTKPRKKK